MVAVEGIEKEAAVAVTIVVATAAEEVVTEILPVKEGIERPQEVVPVIQVKEGTNVKVISFS